jgi:hypothetical protein
LEGYIFNEAINYFGIKRLKGFINVKIEIYYYTLNVVPLKYKKSRLNLGCRSICRLPYKG